MCLSTAPLRADVGIGPYGEGGPALRGAGREAKRLAPPIYRKSRRGAPRSSRALRAAAGSFTLARKIIAAMM